MPDTALVGSSRSLLPWASEYQQMSRRFKLLTGNRPTLALGPEKRWEKQRIRGLLGPHLAQPQRRELFRLGRNMLAKARLRHT